MSKINKLYYGMKVEMNALILTVIPFINIAVSSSDSDKIVAQYTVEPYKVSDTDPEQYKLKIVPTSEEEYNFVISSINNKSLNTHIK